MAAGTSGRGIDADDGGWAVAHQYQDTVTLLLVGLIGDDECRGVCAIILVLMGLTLRRVGEDDTVTEIECTGFFKSGARRS